MKLLLVEDDELLGDAVKTGLSQFGYLVEWLNDGEIARNALKSETFEVIILDLGLPRLSGIRLLEWLRGAGNKTPVIILTALDDIQTKIKGLDAGADDYLTKPFDLNELGARIRALSRRAHGRAESIIYYKNLTINPQAHSVILDNTPIPIHRREFMLLLKLIENQGHVVSREQIMQSLYKWDDEIDSNTLEVHIHNLRKKLDANYIRTIRGVGYMVERENINS